MSSKLTIPPPPLRERQKHRPRPKKEDAGSRWLARRSTPPAPAVVDDEAPPPLLTPPPVAVDLAEPDVHPDPFAASLDDDTSLEPVKREAPRRQKLTRIVATAVGVSALVCVGALLRVLGAHAEASGTLAAQPTAAELPAPSLAPAVEDDTDRARAALELREEARGLLVQRKIDAAIEAAQRATLAAPEDATAWLILGAAQMDANRHADAQATFRACVERAKVGPVAECRSFVR